MTFYSKWLQWVGCGQRQEINSELIRQRRKSKMEDSTPGLELKVKRDLTLRRQQFPLQISFDDTAVEWHLDLKKINNNNKIKYKMGVEVACIKENGFLVTGDNCAVQCNSLWPNGNCVTAG